MNDGGMGKGGGNTRFSFFHAPFLPIFTPLSILYVLLIQVGAHMNGSSARGQNEKKKDVKKAWAQSGCHVIPFFALLDLLAEKRA